MEVTAHTRNSATTKIQNLLQKQLIASFAQRIEDNDGFWEKIFHGGEDVKCLVGEEEYLVGWYRVKLCIAFRRCGWELRKLDPGNFLESGRKRYRERPCLTIRVGETRSRPARENQIANMRSSPSTLTQSCCYGKSCRRRIREGSRRPFPVLILWSATEICLVNASESVLTGWVIVYSVLKEGSNEPQICF